MADAAARLVKYDFVQTYVAANRALFLLVYSFGYWKKPRVMALAKQVLLASYPTPQAEDLVNAWAYAHPDAAEIEDQIRDNMAA